MTMLALFTLAFMGTATASIITDMSNKAALDAKEKKHRKVQKDTDGDGKKEEVDEEYED